MMMCELMCVCVSSYERQEGQTKSDMNRSDQYRQLSLVHQTGPKPLFIIFDKSELKCSVLCELFHSCAPLYLIDTKI